MTYIYETIQFAEDENCSKWSVVLGKLDGLCVPRTSKHVLRDNLNKMGKALINLCWS